MYWNAVKKGFLDELQKIGAVNTLGLSPETLMAQKPAEPMETPGLKKAMDVLDRADAMKTANVLSPATQLQASQKVGEPVTTRAKKGPGFKQQIRGTLVGMKGALPPIG